MLTKDYHFIGSFTELFADGRKKKHLGVYYVIEKKSRFLVTFKPFDYELPIFYRFCILKKKSKNMLDYYIKNLWN